jgi:hypothetical protein
VEVVIERPEYLFGDVQIVRATREACPVCGHPTGDCTGESHPPSRIIGLGTIPSMTPNQTVLVEEDVFGEVSPTPYTTMRVLLAKKGQQIPVERARELGLM